MKYPNIREEELKNKVAQDYFWLYDCSKIIGNVDFCVGMLDDDELREDQESLLWAESKVGSADIYTSIVQLVLTIGKARTFDKFLPPAMLGAFDAEKMAFIPYNAIQDIFYLNDFNWNVTPSNHDTKEFRLIYDRVKERIDESSFIFDYVEDDVELKYFIKTNFVVGRFGQSKTRIDKNNFIAIYNKWLKSVKPTISVDWDVAQKNGIIDGDFYLADLLSAENATLKDKLFVLLENDHYVLDRQIDAAGMYNSKRTNFNDKQKGHTQFWNKYERPPKEEYWDYLVERRDLLVPQDVRERKGSFFTPQVWVELSHEYLAKSLGMDWQDEYYIWDCAAGTGNLLNGLTNKYNVWASTLDKQDVEVIHDRVKNGANLLDNHVFQFDFLNDDFSKLPQSLQNIINDSEKRKKLIIYINPPYAEATSAKTVSGTGSNKSGVAIDNSVNQQFKGKIGSASNEMFALFMARTYDKIPDSTLAIFSKLKFVQGSNFRRFKSFFKAKYLNGFIVPATTFDNVKGKFPIGFTIWDTSQHVEIKKIRCDIYEKSSKKAGSKYFYGNLGESINRWIKLFDDKTSGVIGFMENPTPDFQNNKFLNIAAKEGKRHNNYFYFNHKNMFEGAIYFSVRHAIPATWLNDRDQFLLPKRTWNQDVVFKTDCLTYTLFHGQNRISSSEGTNHWIPFREEEVDAKEKFDSNFMPDFILGRIKPEQELSLFIVSEPIVHYDRTLPFSDEAKAVFAAGKELWKYYHKQDHGNVNASLYDIREFFQGRNASGKMNNKSDDETYNELIHSLRENLVRLASQIEPKIYKYGFLKL